MSLAVLVLSGMLLIVLSADYFTNGVEWFGNRFRLSEGAVGSLLAALGTALPETLVPVVALIFGHPSEAAIGLGAILGAPFMLATLGFMVLGAGLWWTRRPHLSLRADLGPTRRDLAFFLVSFGMAVAAGWFSPAVKTAVGAGLVGLYLWHARRLMVQGGGTAAPRPESPLHLWGGAEPPAVVILAQVAMALGGLLLGAHFFVIGLENVSRRWGWSGFLLSVMITPLATELPEVLNSVIWIRRRRDQLAVGNITGAMAFQASVVPALGLWFSPWQFSPWEWATAALAWGAAAALWLEVRRDRLPFAALMLSGGFYLLFLALVSWGWRLPGLVDAISVLHYSI
ncbi:MAG: sodium:calcium antiporter [Firmicutes bacterium]|nr:sodium:calcium antiporter [Alicyclobacillaceae bacterium]MCL6496476.1 sodium:calcium antiporter [Bacillota bacterium]